jgi:PAS domain S-box-containing protein
MQESDRRTDRRARSYVLPRLCAGVSIAIGASVLVGWALNVEVLKSIIPGLVAMKPNAALGFVLAGIALATIRERSHNRAAIALAAAAAAIGALTLFEYAAGVNLGIDQLLAREPSGQPGMLVPGRMHPTTAFNFTLLGVALILVAADRRYRAAHSLALIAMLVAASAFIAYVYGVRQFTRLAMYNQMALHTTLGMFALATGVLIVRPGRGLMAAITEDSVRGSMARRLLPVAILVPFSLDGLVLLLDRAEWFDLRFAAAIRVTITIAIFVAVIGWLAHSLVDHQRLAAEQRFRSLVEATTAIVWHTPASGRFESEQPAWSVFTGQSFDQLSGWGWLNAIHPDDRANTARVWSQAVASRSLYQVEHRIRRHDGEYRHMSVRAVPILSQDGELCEWVGVHTDIDTEARAEAALREAKDAAEAAARAKGEFLANMSHEIRTPMNGILGMTELALATELTSRQREYLGLVKSSADALLTVIDDILDFSKIEAGKLAIDPVPFRLRDTITDTLRALALRAHGKGLELTFRIDPDLPDTVVGDCGRIRQVLINLVGNAIKFTERGEVCVTIEPGDLRETGRELRVSVVDTGIGIPAAKRNAIFAPFEQADGSTTRKYGGTGLGLTISARLVALMGGRIWVEDNPGGGSVFRFTVQLADDTDHRSEHTHGTGARASIAGRRILVVDDNRTNRLILEELLSRWGCAVRSASGGLEALEALRAAASADNPFDVVLLDMMMPGMDGHSLAWQIRGDTTISAVRIVMLTSGGTDESAQLRALDISRSLPKPVRHSELFASLVDVLEPTTGPIEFEAARALRRQARGLRVLLAEDHPINQKVAARLLESHGHVVTIVEDGRDAVRAAAATDFDVILMDVQMPGLDGFEATAAIRSADLARGRHVPIIALTAHAMAGDRDRCLAAGCDEYLTKPICSTNLRAALERLQDRQCNAPPDVNHTSRESDFDPEAALASVGGDYTLLLELLTLFFDDWPRLFGETRAAAGCADLVNLKRLAHTISGVAVNFAAKGVRDLANRLQETAQTGDLSAAMNACDDLAAAVGRFRQAVDDTYSVSSNARSTED